MSTVQPTYVNHAHLPGTSRVPSNIEEVLAAALAELAGKIDKNKAMHHGASEFSEENTYPAGIFVWYTDTSVPENSGLYICKEDVTVPGPWTGSANWTSMNSVSALFTSANTSNRYEMKSVGNGTSSERVTLTDRAVNVWTVDTSASTLYFSLPERTANRARDLIVAIDLTDQSFSTAPTVNISGSWLVDGSAFPELTTGKVNLLLLSEMMTETTGDVTTGRLTAVVKALAKV